MCCIINNWQSFNLIGNDQDGQDDQIKEIIINSSVNAFWVKICSSWIVGLLYIWTLLAPIIFKNRDFA
jgi:hypothetical protein